MKAYRILVLILTLLICGCTVEQKFNRAQKKFTSLLEDYPALVKYDSTVVVTYDTTISIMAAEDQVTRTEIDTFIHIICDTLKPRKIKEKAIDKLLYDCTFEGLMAGKTKVLKTDSVKVEIYAKGNEQFIKSITPIYTKKQTGFVVTKQSYLSKTLDTWHVWTSLLVLLLLVLIFRK